MELLVVGRQNICRGVLFSIFCIEGSEKHPLSDLGHNHNLFAGQIQLLDGLAEYDLRGTIGIHLPVDPGHSMSPFVFFSTSKELTLAVSKV